ncbi:MAG: NAD(P)(+) transhydrogenase (Re/Si-specific) subunit beta [Sphingobacteriaceae bacterium]|nr:NAD(P)(+) transhydrogenase (Re/Si-specific) subunit beta [Sphingobacteriaceae bacterium]
MLSQLIDISYLVAVVLFVLGIKYMGHPDSARKGNLMAAGGMALAVLATFFTPGLNNIGLSIAGIAIGSVVGWLMSNRIKMTDMPQMVSFFNGMGGAAAALIAIAEVYGIYHGSDIGMATLMLNPNSTFYFYFAALLVSLVVGGVSFTGSIIAMGKLQGFVSGKSVRWPMQKLTNNGLLVVIAALSVLFFFLGEGNEMVIYIILALSLLFGVLFVMPIGGADMPVVISLLNSFTGLTAATTGLLFDNKVMLMGGVLVGSAGFLLTVLMCKAMNRSLTAVLLGAFNSGTGAASDREIDTTYREINLSDASILLAYARKVVIIPGYGLAVAQAQHVVHELEKLLEAKGVEVKYGIHPVAGRMPGHMNVLLAESDVSYDKLIEMEKINDEFPQTDVVVVIGANDVVNPAAELDPASPIYGMPILQADRAQNIIVIKRSMSAGYAGIENELFYNPKTRMLFGDAKSALSSLVEAVKAL